MNKVLSVIDAIPRLLGYLSGVIVVASILLTLIEVIIRYFWGNSLLLADEFGGYFVVAIGFFAVALTWKEKGHVRVSLVISRISQKAVNWIRIITFFLSLVFSCAFTYSCYKFIHQSFHFNTRSGSWMNVPMAYVQLPMIIGITLMTLIILLEFIFAVKKLSTGRNVEEVQ